jgi:acetyl-CoA synthetase
MEGEMTENENSDNNMFEGDKQYSPSEIFAAQANVNDPGIYSEANKNPEAFWAKYAEELNWIKSWESILEWNAPHARWFSGGKLNVCYNCVDRHALGASRDKPAIIWEGEPGDERIYTYSQLLDEVSRAANVLKSMNIKKGDRVAIYLPMIPELVVSLLACARIGAVHNVVFGGFSADSLRERINDSGAKLLITADGGWRRGSVIPLKLAADEALDNTPTIEKTLVVRRIGNMMQTPMNAERDYWWHDLMEQMEPLCIPEEMDSEDPLFILYTSGSTGKPKGILHTTAGYLVGVYTTTRLVFDLKDSDVYWCTADIGWVTGHSYIVYGPLSNGATCVMYEGAPDTPAKDRYWKIIEKRGVTIFYTAPTAIRTFMRWGEYLPDSCNLSSLRLLGSVGEPINPEAWLWYHRVIGKNKCPIVDTWWQTETGHILIAPLPGIVATKPGSATLPFPGIQADVVNEKGEPMPPGHRGYLVLTHPWPGMLRTLWGNDARYRDVYWSRLPGMYFTGDGARKDEDGYFWLLGRVDDVMLVSGHNISTMELESALVEHPAVAEAAVIGKVHEVKGQAPVAFVTVCDGFKPSDALADELRLFVTKKLGAIFRPDEIFFSADLPKTRSGKIMRRLLRDIAEGRILGDTTTLADPGIVASLKEKYASSES